LSSLGPRAETLKQLGNKKKFGPSLMGPRFLNFGALAFPGGFGLFRAPHWRTVWVSRTETWNKKIPKKIEESKRGAPKSAGPPKARGPQKRGAPQSAGPMAYAASAIWLIRHWKLGAAAKMVSWERARQCMKTKIRWSGTCLSEARI
jgi:hypothetical protein